MASEGTTIYVSLVNKERLSDFGKAGESMNTALDRVLTVAEAMRDGGE